MTQQSRMTDREALQADRRKKMMIRRAVAESRLNIRDVCTLIVTATIMLTILYFAATIVLPFVFALIISLLMITPMRFLHRTLRLPKPLAALTLILVMFLVVGGIATAVSVPATSWLEHTSQNIALLQEKLVFLNGPIDFLQRAYNRIISFFMTSQQFAPSGNASGHHEVTSPAFFGSWGVTVLYGTRTILVEFFTTILLLFFFLSSGDVLLRRIIEVMPHHAGRKRVQQMMAKIERNVSIYLATITVMNGLVGLLNYMQCWLLDMPNPLLWGVLAFLLNYIPIIGPLTGVVIYLFVALSSFHAVIWAFAPPLIYLLIHLIEGETITPLLLAKRFTLNPVLVISSLVFWDWMWGIGGAFLSVPMLAVLKIVCDHIDRLTPLGHLIGSSDPVSIRGLEDEAHRK
ncbi:AI-2E family transporter [Candidatus Kirkpatrickella diaphorinae]|uniref:AI-2E family transporter n=1 Tax=Candidatus Kirkpatrickella diaphorinae TaxID=2984322 RepID=A0ABY6GIC1_9PROT|nr:AI-2E family transporter [Candidatus Kirkpatrickella diaphorinae]UYH51057.1 AI-2E family transporter [Candidatus Kirkpatrickella diaphorinae]